MKNIVKSVSCIILVLVMVLGLTACGDKKEPAAPAADTVNTADVSVEDDILAEYLAKQDPELKEEDRITVSDADLSVNESLPGNVRNILLLGTDARRDVGASRSDTMIVCSINTDTGKVKLTSIMRDMAVQIPGKGTNRINSANYYGGPKLAIKLVNECFGLNIREYALVNFGGFEAIAEAVGGVEVNLTEAEVEQVNHNVTEQIWLKVVDKTYTREEGIEVCKQNMLSAAGANTHLNGLQTLGYARIRKVDSDYARTERQRLVLNLLMQKLHNVDAATLMTLGAQLFGFVQTNMNLNDILQVAIAVLQSDSFSQAEELRVPVAGTYSEEKRNDDAMLYDTDFAANSKQVYTFIYGAN